MRYSPWTDLASRPHITFGITRLPEGRAWWLPEIPGIVLDERSNRVQRRVDLTHELMHVDAGDTACHLIGPDGPRQALRQELRADQAAARLLIEIKDLAGVLAWTFDNREIAAELDVSVEMVETRAAHLHPAERHYLRRRMAQREAVA